MVIVGVVGICPSQFVLYFLFMEQYSVNTVISIVT